MSRAGIKFDLRILSGIPAGLWSLWDMIDFHLREFMKALAEIDHARTVAHLGDRDEYVSPDDIATIGDQLSRIKYVCKDLRMPRAMERLDNLTMLFSPSAASTYGSLFSEIYELFNAIERYAGDEYFCHYRKDRLVRSLSLKNLNPQRKKLRQGLIAMP